MCTQLSVWTSAVSLCGVGVTASYPQSWIEAVNKFILLRSSVVTHLLPQALRPLVFSFFPSWEPSRGKSVQLVKWIKIRAQRDWFSPLGSGNWFVPLHLSPREVFPCSWRKTLHLCRGVASRTIAAGSPQATAERRALQSHLTVCLFHQW